jgi:diguanylate cyclase (GGDEF)-like protein
MLSDPLTLAATATTAGWGLTATIHAARLHRRLHTDPLTGIGNRAALARTARRAARRSAGLVGLLLADLDGFKAINDAHGHDFGNRVLAAIAGRLAETAGPGELPVRLHGDEFALWLGALVAPEQAEQRRYAVAAALATPVVVGGRRITAAGSVGAAVGPAATPLAELLAAADTGMYRAKRTHHARRPAALPAPAPRRVRDRRSPHPAA